MSMQTDREEEAAAHVHGICLKTGPPQRVGVELEWLVRDARDPARPVTAERIARAASVFDSAAETRGPVGPPALDATGGSPPGPLAAHAEQAGQQADAGAVPRPRLPSSSAPGVLPSGALLTAEPGGQLELSSLPADSLAQCVSATVSDMAALRAAVSAAGLELAGYGLDPLRPPLRVLDLPRYAAMEAFFDRGGPWGRRMMCGTASVQVCLDAGDDSDGPAGYRYRWRLVHALGPVLVAAFANSPLRVGQPTGWRSSRQQVWAHMDPGRTRPLRPDGRTDPRDEWVDYALDAEVMVVRDPASPDWAAPPGMTLRSWLRDGECLPRRPTTEDLAYHLSTLFPPVRPRGYLELRMIDAQRGDGWIVPLAVATALVEDERAAETAMAACEPLAAGPGGDPWLRAARLGPSDPVIGRASRECFAAARDALDRMEVPAAIGAVVDHFTEQYVARDRCPADDLTRPDEEGSP
ncbi:MAG TPA: ergothioneine biosynthesis glutamate--cysteine ligase EgtA [Trebonia sp.]|jgi:glutamate--cysteine ligase|nr:ergothioneine biosynthesis glutamate--cysteine ligase EgtA [Trebonia sp.]